MTASMAHKLIHISTWRAAPAKTVAQIVNNAAEGFFSSRLINNPHNRRVNQLRLSFYIVSIRIDTPYTSFIYFIKPPHYYLI
jgi:hypothetical protein